MWMSVLLLAIALNAEPTRLVLVPVLLARQTPHLQLVAFLAGNVTISLGSGFILLFMVHDTLIGTASTKGNWIQTALGALALAAAAVIALRGMRAARHPKGARGDEAREIEARPRGSSLFTKPIKALLNRSRAPWVAGVIGIGSGLPSVEVLAVIALIATSGTRALEQAAVFVAFVLTGNLVVLAPLAGFLVAPDRTRRAFDRFGIWVRSGGPFMHAGLLAALGCLLIGIGTR